MPTKLYEIYIRLLKYENYIHMFDYSKETNRCVMLIRNGRDRLSFGCYLYLEPGESNAEC